MPLSSATGSVIDARGVFVRYHVAGLRGENTLRARFSSSLAPRPRSRLWGPRESVWALRDVNLAVRPGEVIGLIGRNGSGKTTLLMTLAGIIGTDSGSISVQGRIGCLLSFGVGFNPQLTGQENIFLNGSMIGLPRRTISERLDEIIDLSELGDFIHAPVRTYSRGMRVRLGFSIAVHMFPDVLLLDEVLTVGDESFRARTGNLIERIRDDRRSIVIASHSLSLIRRLCTRAIWLDGGQIRLDGSPDDVCQAYLDEVRHAPPPRQTLQGTP